MTKKATRQTPLERRTEDLISVTEAARISGLTTSFIRRLLRTGRVEGIKISRNWLTTEGAIRAYLLKERRRGRPRKSGEG